MRKRWMALIAAIILLFVVVIVLAVSISSPIFKGIGNNIALIPVKGDIVSDSPELSNDLSAMEIIEKIEEAEDNSTVRAIFLEINSGGGDVVASRQVVEKVREAKKPVIAWISDVGASGAYYIAAASDYVIADPDSITGSIGVISMIPNFEGLMEKIGVKMKIIAKGENKAIGSPFEEMTSGQEKIFQELIDQAFQRFRKDIIDFRGEKLDRQGFERIADGRILSGTQAKAIGLIDELGSRQSALRKAAELGGIKDFEILDYSKKELSGLEMLSKLGYNFGYGFRKGMLSSSIEGISARAQ